MNNSIYRKASLDKISSPEQLNDYIKVSNPGIWIVLAAAFILLAAAVVWSATGSLTASVSASGIADAGKLICYLSPEEAAEIKAGMKVNIEDGTGKVESVADTPLSANEISDAVGNDYIVNELSLSRWNFKVTISTDINLANDKIYNKVSIITDEMRPIDFLFN